MAATLEDAISETRGVLQPLFAKPKLSTKLLSKPPFRFIHDIVVATLRATGFPNGYFGLEELDSAQFKDSKSAKMAFLNKLIAIVEVGSGSVLDVSASRIVAGLEPQKTNVLLCTFGRLAQDEVLARDDLIQHVLAGKGIEEFQCKNAALPAPATEANATETIQEGSAATLPATETEATSAGDLDASQDGSACSPVMEQIQACNEDLEQTRAAISAIVAKPKCTDKLLSKPPFRFLHDIIMAIGSQTGFDLRQIFSEDELVSSNVKDKQPKLQFLDKLINFLETNLEMALNVKPTKIISGLEPGRTRYLMQVFVVVATTNCLVPADTQEPSDSNMLEANVEEAKEASPAKSGEEEKDEDSLSLNVNSKEPGFDEKSLCKEKEHVPAETFIVPTNSPLPLITGEEESPKELASSNSFLRPATSRGERMNVASLLNQSPAASAGTTRPTTALGKTRDAPIRDVVRPATAVNKGRGNAALTEELKSKEAKLDEAVILPAKLEDYDFQSLAEAIGTLASAVAPIGTFVNGIIADTEGSQLVSQQDAWEESMQKQREEKLKSLAAHVQKQVSEIKRLEENVSKNDKILKSHGVAHA